MQFIVVLNFNLLYYCYKYKNKKKLIIEDSNGYDFQ